MPKSSSKSKVPSLLLLGLLGAAASSLLVSPAPAYACSCSRPGVEVAPGAGVAAPINTVVRVSWWIGEVKVDESTLQVAPAAAAASAGKPRSKKDKDKVADPVESETSAFTAGQVRTVTLRPKLPLEPETRYEVRAASVAGEKLGVIGEFTTGPAADDKPPEWAGVSKAIYVHQPAVCCNCSTNDPYAQIDLADAGNTSDDATPPAALVYGVWLDDGSKLEPGAAPAGQPVVVTRAWSGKLYLGHKSECAPVNFELPGKATTVKLRVAPIDLAGHVGKVVNVSVDVPKPKEPPARPPAKR